MAALDSNYKAVAKRVRAVGPLSQKNLRAALKAELGPVIAEARSRASWSSRVPSAIVPQVGAKGVALRVNRKKAPHGKIYEFGGRHPIFGRWVSGAGDVAAKPYARPAVQGHKKQIRASMGVAIGRANKEAGF